MGKLIKLTVIVLAALFLTGCAGFSELVQDIQETDATTEIGAVNTLVKDVVDNPWDDIASIGLGYILALLRRKYKVYKGAK